MISLAGTLEGIGLPALVRFLTSLGSNGRLLVADDIWGGEVGFDGGRVVTARFGAERGLAALEAIALALPGGEFRFTGGAPPDGEDVDLPADELERYLTSLGEEQQAIARVVPSLGAVPHVVDAGSGGGVSDRITIDRSTLYSLLLVDGRRTLHAICEGRPERGAAQTLKELAWLAGTGLVTIPPPESPTTAVSATAPAPDPFSPPADAPAAGERAGDDAPSATPQGSDWGAGGGGRGASGGSGSGGAPRSSAFSSPAGGGGALVLAGGPGLVATGELAGEEGTGEGDQPALRYWRRTLVLALLALTLLALSWWQQSRWSGGDVLGAPLLAEWSTVSTVSQP